MVEKGNKRKGGSSSGGSSKSKKPKGGDAAESMTKSAQKRQVRKDRQSQRRHADVVEEAKALWNKLRLKTNTTKDTKKLVEKLMDLITGKISEIALQHDASRVVQAAIQFGNMEQRKIILGELCTKESGSLPELAKIQYAHFCCLKLIKYCHRDAECAKTIVREFKGHISKLAVHAVAARVIESLFLTMPPRLIVGLKQEFYGPHFALFAPQPSTAGKGKKDAKNLGPILPTLSGVLQDATDSQKKNAINFVKEMVNKTIQKEFFGYAFFQDLFCEYADVADGSDLRPLIPSVADHALHMLSTRSGAKAVASCASYGTPKDRKRLLKSLKGYTRSSLMHRDAYFSILRLVQVTDDTVSVHKSLLNEILTAAADGDEKDGDDNAEKEETPVSPLLELALDENASKLFLLLLPKDDKIRMKYFDPWERDILGSMPTIRENGADVPTSKKDPEIRQRELLSHLKPALLEMCVNHADELMRSLPGSRVLKEVYAAWSPTNVIDATVSACVASLDSDANGADEDGSTQDAPSSVFEDPAGHLIIKHMVLLDAERTSQANKSSSDGDDGDEHEPAFSKALFEKVCDRFTDVASSNRGAFVMTALCKVESLAKQVKSKLKPEMKEWKKLSKGKGATAGYAALLKEIS